MFISSLLPLFDATMLNTLVAEPCFLWLCITAHSHCLSLCTSLPTLPPLTYQVMSPVVPRSHLLIESGLGLVIIILYIQPLSVKFIQDSNAALETLIELADTSQLQVRPLQLYRLIITISFSVCCTRRLTGNCNLSSKPNSKYLHSNTIIINIILSSVVLE